jgi:DNA-binding LacI/PurR family transcriptional regulator
MKTQMMPAYMRIRQYLIQKIHTGNVGDKIPSEKELCNIFGVMRPTVRAALKGLTDSGELIAQKGVGVFIARTPLMAVSNPVGIIVGDGRHAYNGFNESLLLSGILSEFPRYGLTSTFLNRSEDPEQFPNAVKSLDLKEVIWIGPNDDLLRLFRRACPDIKLVAVGHCFGAFSQNAPSEGYLFDGYAVWDVYEEALRIGRHFFGNGAKRLVWAIPKNSRDDFEAYVRGFDTAAKEFGLDPEKAWKCVKRDALSSKDISSIFNEGPVGIYSHMHFLLDFDNFARDNRLAFGKDYFLLARDNQLFRQNPNIKADVSFFDLADIGCRGAEILARLIKKEETETQVKIAPEIICWNKNKQVEALR